MYFWWTGWCYLWLPFGRAVFTVSPSRLDACVSHLRQKHKYLHLLLSIPPSWDYITNFILSRFFCHCWWWVFPHLHSDFLLLWASTQFQRVSSCNCSLFDWDLVLYFLPSKCKKIKAFYHSYDKLCSEIFSKKCKCETDIICKITATFIIYRKLITTPEISCMLSVAMEVLTLL